MKQKYAITVADMELNIISDASPDEVENIVSILDRRMRDINLKSPRCTKNEAAILCALSYCSERIAMQEAFKKVEKDAFRFAGENEKLKQTIESMQLEMDNLRKDAAVMRSILDRASITAVAPTPAETEAKKPEAAPEEPVAPAPAEAPAPSAEEDSQKKNTKPQKNRVGTMFDLLTFSDV
ncbi:MAG: cell division protein ZapA [Clostridia bacterium]|nr:cell division protein ZapA [Clostridia bacterium]